MGTTGILLVLPKNWDNSPGGVLIQVKTRQLQCCEAGEMVDGPGSTRTPDLVVERLRRDELRVSYPLIRYAQPEVDLRNWVRFAWRLVQLEGAARSGIVAARYAGQRFPCGLFCYRREHDLRRGLVVTAEHLVAVDLFDPQPVLAALFRELDALGARLGCDAVRIAVPPGPQAAFLRRCMVGQDDATTLARPLHSLSSRYRHGSATSRSARPSKARSPSGRAAKSARL
jgi:hypothetical protein